MDTIPMDIDVDPPALETQGPLRSARLFNPYATRADSRQLDESVDAFLARLPPCPGSEQPGWYWIANPHLGLEDYHRLQRSDVNALKEEGRILFERYRRRRTMPDVNSKELEKEIALLAQKTGVLDGKWMLFPSLDDVNDIWARVAHATAAGRLGTSAKVASSSDSGEEDPKACRLICVFTNDFTDEADVRRVLLELVRMGLVPSNEGRKGKGGIVYKCDAYTHLGIYKGNEWGVRPSVYSSVRMLQ